jgi:SAM-dependent methyltransferase
MSKASLPADYFDALYAGDPDPWRFRTSDYERDKYADTVAALDGRRFEHAVEIGCSIGELTARLAPLCDDLLGVDIAQAALDAAAARNRETPQVHFQKLALPDERPDGVFDLIVLSEVLYYFGPEDLKRVAAWVQTALAPGGVVLMVHWLGETPDYPHTGDAAVEAFTQALQPALTTDRRSRRAQYRLDRMSRRR